VGNRYNVQYGYKTSAEGNATMQVSEMKYTLGRDTMNFQYHYDAGGNIIDYYDPIQGHDVNYKYDSLNQ